MLSDASNPSSHTVDLADQADKAVLQLFGNDSTITHSVTEITQSLRQDLARIRQGQSAGPVTLAIVGKVGEGKSWLTRTFINETSSAKELFQQVQSGQNAAERSMNLTWIGTQKHFSQLSEDEKFLKTSPHNLLDLGAPYFIADSPGFSDHDPKLEAVSSVALMSSNIKLLATSVSNIRDASLASFVESMDGSIILPIIRFRPEGDNLTPADQVIKECLIEMENWHILAANANILPAIFIPDGGIAGHDRARDQARTLISATLSPMLDSPETLQKHREAQLKQRTERTRDDLASALSAFRSKIGAPVDKLDSLTGSLPLIIQKEVIGDPAQLEIGIRSRFRADAIERTPAILFPYRSLMGVLGLTHGAWDRLIFTTLGSVPSLIMTAFHSVKSWNKSRDFEQSLKDQSRQRLKSLLNDAYREDLENFSKSIHSITNNVIEESMSSSSNMIEIQGLTGIEIDSHDLIRETVQKHRISNFCLWIGGLLSFLLFWAMLLGPAIALYTDYFSVLGESAKSITEKISNDWQSYPTPPASLWLTSLMLSLIPAGIIAMIAMYTACSKRRIKKSALTIQQGVSQIIRDRMASGHLKLVLNNKKINAAKTLLSLSAPIDKRYY